MSYEECCMTFIKSTIILTFILSSNFALAAKRNVCDDLVESGSSEADITRCIAKFGESDTYKKYIQRQALESGAQSIQNESKIVQSNKVTMKKFTEAELDEISFGKSFYATKKDYSSLLDKKEEVLTSGDNLCKYLGYEKAIRSTLSPEIGPKKAHKNGLILDKTLFGKIKEEPKMYEDAKYKFNVRKYIDITCAKTEEGISKAMANELKEMVESVNRLNKWPSEQNSPVAPSVDNSQRSGQKTKPAKESVPYQHKTPDFMKSISR